mgnify:CR=1 FL=1|jgi:hypothetical protein
MSTHEVDRPKVGVTQTSPDIFCPEEFLNLAETGVDNRISGIVSFRDAVLENGD